MTPDEADCIVEYIRALEDCKGNSTAVENHLVTAGYNPRDVDSALKYLGRVAGRDCSLY